MYWEHFHTSTLNLGVALDLTGVLNVVHGGRETVDFICDAPEIKAISFVGGNQVSESANQSIKTVIRCSVISKACTQSSVISKACTQSSVISKAWNYTPSNTPFMFFSLPRPGSTYSREGQLWESACSPTWELRTTLLSCLTPTGKERVKLSIT